MVEALAAPRDEPRDEDTAGLLCAVRGGDASARGRLYERLYGELKELAASHLRGERHDLTVTPTVLVHETCLRLLPTDLRARDRGEFFSLASTVMRRVLIDGARRRQAGKRPPSPAVTWDDAHPAPGARDAELLALDDALARLAEAEPQLARLVELRFFGGFSVEETAALLELSTATVKRRWRLAKAWLHREIERRG